MRTSPATKIDSRTDFPGLACPKPAGNRIRAMEKDSLPIHRWACREQNGPTDQEPDPPQMAKSAIGTVQKLIPPEISKNQLLFWFLGPKTATKKQLKVNGCGTALGNLVLLFYAYILEFNLLCCLEVMNNFVVVFSVYLRFKL